MGQYFEGAHQVFGESLNDEDGLFVGNKKGVEGYGIHLGTIAPIGAGELTVGLYYAHAKLGAFTADDPEDSLKKTKADYYGFGTRYCYPLSTRTTVYVGAGYAETKYKEYDDQGVEKATEKTGGAYFGVAHSF